MHYLALLTSHILIPMLKKKIGMLNKAKLTIFVFIILGAIIDLINGYLLNINAGKIVFFSLGVLFRILLIFWSFFSILTLKTTWLKLYIFLVLAFVPFQLLTWNVINFVSNTRYELYTMIRSPLPFMFLAVYLRLHKKKAFKDYKSLYEAIRLWGAIGGVSIVLSLFGWGYNTYGGIGQRGFFSGQNSVSCSMLISLTVSLMIAFQSGKIKDVLISLLIAFATILIMSRASALGTVGIFFAYISFFSIKNLLLPMFNTRFKLVHFLRSIIVFAICLSFLCLGVTRYISLVKDSTSTYLLGKYQALLEEGTRVTTKKVSWEIFEERGLLKNIIGEGALNFQLKVASKLGYFGPGALKGPELDYLDLLGNYGIIFTFLIYLGIFFFFYKALVNFLKFNDIVSFTNFVAISIFLAHSFLAGHAIPSIKVSTLMAPMYFLILIGENRDVRHDLAR